MNLSSCYLFEGLSGSHLERLEAIASRQPVREGQWMYHKDEPAEFLYVIESGAVELLIEVQDLLQFPLITVEASSVRPMSEVEEPVEIPTTMIRGGYGCVGIGALIEPFRYSLSARCVRDGELFVIRQTDILLLINQFPDLGCRIMTNLARKLIERLNETRREVQIHLMRLMRSATF